MGGGNASALASNDTQLDLAAREQAAAQRKTRSVSQPRAVPRPRPEALASRNRLGRGGVSVMRVGVEKGGVCGAQTAAAQQRFLFCLKERLLCPTMDGRTYYLLVCTTRSTVQ